MFILLAVACPAAAVVRVGRDSRPVWFAAAGTCAAAVAALVWSRAVGLPQITDDVGRWTEPLALVAITAESLVVALAAAALYGARHHYETVRNRVPALAAVALLVLGLGWTGVAAASDAQRSDADSMSGMPGMGSADKDYWNEVGGAPFVSDGVTRTYYISADLVTWDYAPDGKNEMTGKPFDHVADTYVKTGPGRIGSRYLKCLYRGYSDSSFKHREVRAADEQYLGLLGPVIRAEVGDTIKVVFRNTCPFPASMHPHGVLYTKSSEGAPYNDNTSGANKFDDAVKTGRRHTYVWDVPERAGPGPHDGSSVMWMYHSHTQEIGDTYAGLMGPIEITARGMARADGSPKDVDQEVFSLFSVMNEGNSPLLNRNEHKFETPYRPVVGDDEGFEESNLKHSINGYLFGNQPMVTVKRGERVRWYVMSMGTEVDLHTPHWHGNDVVVGGMRMDVVSLLPAGMVVADMVPDNPGIWAFHCHVNDHIKAGMLTRYTVTP